MKQRVLYFDLLNILGAVCVILLHCNDLVHHYREGLGWIQAMIVQVVCYWAVPVFYMLSGATLMTYRERYFTKDFFKKRLLRTAVPFVIWTVVSAAVRHMMPWDIGWRTFASRFVTCKLEEVFWFFPPLFALYLAMPVLSKLKDDRKLLWYMTGTAFVLFSVLPQIFKYVGVSWNGNLQMPVAAGMVQFVLLGYLLSTQELGRKVRYALYACAAGGVLLRFFGTWFLSAQAGTLDRLFFGYSDYHSVLLGAAVFVFFKQLRLERLAANEKAVRVIKTLSGCSLGVYLMHMTIYRILDDLIPTGGWQWRLLVPFLIYGLAVCLVLLFKRIPLIKHTVP